MFLVLTNMAHGAPCCGAGFTIPSIITSDDKAQLALSYNYAKIYADVFTNGDWRHRKEDDHTETYKFEGAHIFADRWQAGFSVPYQKRVREGAMADSSAGFGDIAFQLGYEYLPDWDYNPYRPKGIGYLSLITPTGRSIYESEDGSGIDSRGRGFWGVGAGTVLVKNWRRWDANANFEFHHSFDKKVNNKTTKGTVKPNNGGSISVGSGYNFSKLRLGALIAWYYEDPTDVVGTTPSKGELKRYATGSLLLSYMITEQQSVIMSYSDQTIFGSPYNTSLSKSITLFYQKRWQR
ncbi:hypothetical protein ACJVC5_16135 [Peredibacter sp. HCB2-198]|uniref:hypothetical protein n=1 Tax=Peredibacter sp. HCB2-198 TaxID=3383025 RepID=UPI0038B58607